MLLVSKRKDDPGIHEWVAKTREQMSAEELARHHLVTIGFHYAILPQSNGISFEQYLDELEATQPPFQRKTIECIQRNLFNRHIQKEKASQLIMKCFLPLKIMSGS
jgi:hypothetical protein